MSHYARTGNVNAPQRKTVPLSEGGDEVALGKWLDRLRSGHTQSRWARPILQALGMTGLPATQAEAQAQALEQALALADAPRLPPGPGEAAAAGLLQTLSGLETRLAGADRSLARNLRAAVLHYASTGNVNATRATRVPLSGGSQVHLGEWLYSLRRGSTKPRWTPPILQALGMKGLPATPAEDPATREPPAEDPAAAGPASQPGQARPRPVPVFSRVEVAIDQARREEVRRIEGEAELGETELMITGWRLETHRLAYRAESDQEFPWRDPADPLNRVYAPYADTDGRLHPAVRARAARIGPVQTLLQQMALRRAAADYRPAGLADGTRVPGTGGDGSGPGHHRGAAGAAADPGADPGHRRRTRP